MKLSFIIIIVILVGIGIYIYYKQKSNYQKLLSVYHNAVSNLPDKEKMAVWSDLNNDMNSLVNYVTTFVDKEDQFTFLRNTGFIIDLMYKYGPKVANIISKEDKTKLQSIYFELNGLMGKYTNKFRSQVGGRVGNIMQSIASSTMPVMRNSGGQFVGHNSYQKLNNFVNQSRNRLGYLSYRQQNNSYTGQQPWITSNQAKLYASILNR